MFRSSSYKNIERGRKIAAAIKRKFAEENVLYDEQQRMNDDEGSNLETKPNNTDHQQHNSSCFNDDNNSGQQKADVSDKVFQQLEYDNNEEEETDIGLPDFMMEDEEEEGINNNIDNHSPVNYNHQYNIMGIHRQEEDFQYKVESFNANDDCLSDNYYSIIECMVPLFSIKKLSHYFLSKLLNPTIDLHSDDTKLIDGNHGVLKGSFARAFSNVCMKYSILENAQGDILNLFFNATKTATAINLPVLPLEKKELSIFKIDNYSDGDGNVDDDDVDDDETVRTITTIGLEDQNIRLDIERYVQAKNSQRFVSITQCENDCFVYAGIENSKEFNCLSCGLSRFKPCSRSACSGKGSTVCDHLKIDGIPKKQLFYRPILVLIADLLRTPNFLNFLNYERKSLECDKSCYMDIMDGAVPQLHLQQMKVRFKKYCSTRISTNDIKEVNILASEFYDGGQLFKRRFNNFWGMFLGILNLPPSFRGKLGISYFILALYAGKHANAERFLMLDCVCEELRMLSDGVEQLIEGQLYFIQLRLILHVLDSRAVEPMLEIQSTSNSKQGCPLCGCLNGLHIGNKCIYIGLRHTLTMNHWLRHFGQSGNCCPKDFYSREKTGQWFTSTEQTFLSSSESLSALDLLTKNKKNKAACNNICLTCNDDERIQSSFLKFFSDIDTKFDWYHYGEFEFQELLFDKKKGLRRYLFYRHFDLRQQKEFRRISNAQHLDYAERARKKTLLSKRII